MEKLADKQQIPFLVDTTEGHWMFESDEIIRYLEKHAVKQNLYDDE